MFLYQMIFLALAWMFIGASERIFLRLQVPMHLNWYTDWWTILIFRPLHLMLAFVCFISAFLIIRYITQKYLRFLFSKGSLLKRNRLESLALLLLGWWILAVTLMKHPIPATVMISVLILYDFVQWLASNRRNKRLKTVFKGMR